MPVSLWIWQSIFTASLTHSFGIVERSMPKQRVLISHERGSKDTLTHKLRPDPFALSAGSRRRCSELARQHVWCHPVPHDAGACQVEVGDGSTRRKAARADLIRRHRRAGAWVQ